MRSRLNRWHLLHAGQCVRRHWADEDEWLVYHALSGDTHLLNAGAIAVLDRLAVGPASVDDLVLLPGAVSRGALHDVLDVLDHLGLAGPLLS